MITIPIRKEDGQAVTSEVFWVGGQRHRRFTAYYFFLGSWLRWSSKDIIRNSWTDLASTERSHAILCLKPYKR